MRLNRLDGDALREANNFALFQLSIYQFVGRILWWVFHVHSVLMPARVPKRYQVRRQFAEPKHPPKTAIHPRSVNFRVPDTVDSA